MTGMLLNVGALGDRMDVKLSGEFIVEQLGVAPTAREKRAMLFDKDAVLLVMDRLIEHLKKTREDVLNDVEKSEEEDDEL